MRKREAEFVLLSAATPGEKKASALKRLQRLQPFPPVVVELMYIVGEEEAKSVLEKIREIEKRGRYVSER